MILLGGQNLKLSVMLPRKKPRNGIETLKGSPPGPLGWGWRWWSRDTHRGHRPVYHIFLESKKYQCASIKIILSVIFQEGFMGESEAGRPWCDNSSDTPEPVLSSHLLPFFLVSLGEETFPLLAFLLREVFICFKGPGIICHELSKIMETKQEVKQGWWNQSLFGCHLSFLILLLELSSKQSFRRKSVSWLIKHFKRNI